MMHASGMQTVVVTIEELTIKVRLLKLSLGVSQAVAWRVFFNFTYCYLKFPFSLGVECQQ